MFFVVLFEDYIFWKKGSRTSGHANLISLLYNKKFRRTRQKKSEFGYGFWLQSWKRLQRLTELFIFYQREWSYNSDLLLLCPRGCFFTSNTINFWNCGASCNCCIRDHCRFAGGLHCYWPYCYWPFFFFSTLFFSLSLSLSLSLSSVGLGWFVFWL